MNPEVLRNKEKNLHLGAFTNLRLPVSPIQPLAIPGYRVFMKRDDLLALSSDDPLCGNKWRKLKYNLEVAKQLEFKTLLTFGGAYSNHIAAVASAGKQFHFRTIGVIRGEEQLPLNPTLTEATNAGMQLHYLDRTTFRRKMDPEVLQSLADQHGKCYILPEGGTNDLAITGVKEIVDEIKEQLGYLPDFICVSCGTGGTLAGIIQGASGKNQIVGFAALKGNFLEKEVRKWIDPSHDNWEIQNNYHFGGYAKITPELAQFIQSFKVQFQIQLEPIYTGKMLFGLMDLIKKEYFPKGSSIVVVHTGGLQGLRGMRERYPTLFSTP